MYATTKQSGQVMAASDVCKVPAPPGSPIPTPFVNTGNPAVAFPVSPTVNICGQPVLTNASKIVITNGDQAGSLGGILSNVIMGCALYISYSLVVKFDGNPAVSCGNSTSHNESNTTGADIKPTQYKVQIGVGAI